MAKKKKSDKEVLHKIVLSAVRAEQKNQGAFDGRFREKKVPNKKKTYKRKKKHKKVEDE